MAVLTGFTLALWTVDLLGIAAGRRLTRSVPLAAIHRVAGILLLVFGGIALVKGLR